MVTVPTLDLAELKLVGGAPHMEEKREDCPDGPSLRSQEQLGQVDRFTLGAEIADGQFCSNGVELQSDLTPFYNGILRHAFSTSTLVRCASRLPTGGQTTVSGPAESSRRWPQQLLPQLVEDGSGRYALELASGRLGVPDVGSAEKQMANEAGAVELAMKIPGSADTVKATH